MKKFVFNVIAILGFSFGIISCNSDETHLDSAEPSTEFSSRVISLDDEIVQFEKKYVQNYSLTEQNEVRLVGFKTMELKGKDKEVFQWIYKNYKAKIDSLKGIFVAPDFSFYRVYFPLHTAIADYSGNEVKANEFGIVKLPVQASRASVDNLSVIGRMKSDGVAGCGSNIILEDRILLKDKMSSSKFFDRTYIFDMGLIDCCDEMEGQARATACTQNHLPYANCSDAFRIYGDNCVTRRDVCMDFNGFGSDCVKGPKTYFVGSDCNIAMLAGHCWNEVM